MELQFQKSPCRCLQQVKYETKEQEQTQEVRLEDSMPDIGRVVGAWGQVILRGKEWQNGQLSVSGGIMAWVVYMSEDESSVQSVETWLPFQLRWDSGNTQHDGTILAGCLLRSIDARSTSARKLMVRGVVSVLVEAFVQEEIALSTPHTYPQDLQILTNSYPVLLPKEAGEKPFTLEEELVLPAGCPAPEKLLRYSIQPELIDKKILGGRIVFRGAVSVHVLYRCADGKLHSCDMEFPFSQFSELDQSYEQEALASVLPAVTGMELELLPEGKFLLKAGLTGQYTVYDRSVLELSQDAYSTRRQVQLVSEALQVPVVLNMDSQTIRPECSLQVPAQQIVDTAFYPQHGKMHALDAGTQLQVSGQFRVLHYDENDRLQCINPDWEDSVSISVGEGVRTCQQISLAGNPQCMSGGQCSAGLVLETVCIAGQPLTMLTGITIAEEEDIKQDRPSLILRKKGSDSLWEVAKSCASTVDAIKQANQLTKEPEDTQILLIPVC